MDNKALIAALKSAQAAIDNLREQVDSAMRLAAGESAQKEELGEQEGACRYCGNPLYQSQRKQRGLHLHCYNDAYARYVKTNEYTTDDLEAQGLFDPVAKRGRKPRKPRKSLTTDPMQSGKQTAPKLTSQRKPKRKEGQSRKAKPDEQ